MSMDYVLNMLLEANVCFTSDDFVRNCQTDRFSSCGFKLVGLWLTLYAQADTKTFRQLSNCAPWFTLPSMSGRVVLFAWPLEEKCCVKPSLGSSDEK